MSAPQLPIILAPGTAALNGVAMRDDHLLKMACSLICLIVLSSNLWTMRNWTERTGVYDDICYLRQAHLFQRFGLSGFDTDITRDDDQYFSTLAREIGYPAWNDQNRAPCHTAIGSKRVLQYPPGTGFVLSIFPAGFQRVPLYTTADIVLFAAVIFAIWSARSRQWIVVSAAVGTAALYFMVNPAKASASIAPTMIICAIVGFLTDLLINDGKRFHRLGASVLAGLLMGLAVSFRLPNLFLSVGYFAILFATVVWSRKSEDVLRLISFGAAYLVGLIPTLVANAINAGSALSTTYGASDVVPPDLSFSVTREYLADTQGALMILVIVWTLSALISRPRKAIAAIVGVNLFINLMFFLSHPIFIPYYLMPLGMLSLWTLLFSGNNRKSPQSNCQLPELATVRICSDPNPDVDLPNR
jgi:hypothetical protein